MVTISLFFWIFVVIFAVIGAMRGWAQEALVSVSLILSLFIIFVIGLVPFTNGIIINGFVNPGTKTPVLIDSTTFWIRTAIVVFFAFFGYQTPKINIARVQKATKRSERLQDTLLGILVGGFNGYLLFGTLWFFLIQANYVPLASFVYPPDPSLDPGVFGLMEILPPTFLAGNTLLFAIAIALAFIIIVFI